MKKQLLLKVPLIIMFAIFFVAECYAKDISGHISVDTTWDDMSEPYILNGDLYIDSGATLTLASGATLRTKNAYHDILIDGRLEAADATIDLLYYSSSGHAADLRVRAGGELDLTGGFVRGPGQVTIEDGGTTDFTGVTFAFYDGGNSSVYKGSPKVVYAEGSSGTVADVQKDGDWHLTIGSDQVSVPTALPAGAVTLSAPVSVAQAMADMLTVSADATVTDSTIGTVSVTGSSPVLRGNTIGSLTLSAGTPVIEDNTITGDTPFRLTDPDTDTGNISGNTFDSADPWVEIEGALDASRTLGLIDGVLGQYRLRNPLKIVSGVTLILASGVTIQSRDYDIFVEGRLEATNATIGLLYYATPEYAVDLRVRDGGELALTGGSVRGPGQVTIEDGGTADFTGVTFAFYDGGNSSVYKGSPKVVYAEGSSGNALYTQFSDLQITSGIDLNISQSDFSKGTVDATGNSTSVISLHNNWWGTEDFEEIESKIAHQEDDPNRPTVTYQPILENSPFWSISHSPIGAAAAPVNTISFYFDHEMDQSSFSPVDDIVSFTGPNGEIAISSYEWTTSKILTINFNLVSSLGQYQMVIGPDIRNVLGTPMFQDDDLVPGENPDDQYYATFVIKRPYILHHTPSGSVTTVVNAVQFEFDQPMDTGSFSIPNDIVSFKGPGGEISLDQVSSSWIDDQILEITFLTQSEPGHYEMILGPAIENLQGYALDNNNDQIGGDALLDRYIAKWRILFISGEINKDTEWYGGVILISESVDINATLTIHSGTILKFSGETTGINVNGKLELLGTPESPVIMTSIRDDAAGGDTNDDDGNTTPGNFDWQGIRINGSGEIIIENAVVRYASTAIDADASGARVVLKNTILSDSGSGVYVYKPYVEVTGINCLIARNVHTAIFVRADSSHKFINCTIVENGAGIHLGGAKLMLQNCIVAYNANGLNHSGDIPDLSIMNSDFYNPAGQEIVWDGDPGRPDLSADRNINADPHFIRREDGNYELDIGSPAIDSGSGIQVPQTDIRGRSRYDDPGMANTGSGYPSYVDMGAFERQGDTPAKDLAVTEVSGPDADAVDAGDSLSLTWAVENRGDSDISGPWTDAVYLSSDTYLDLNSDILLGEASHNNGLTTGKRYNQTWNGTIPTGVAGPQYIIVQTNCYKTFREADFYNNHRASNRTLAVSIPSITVGSQQTGAHTEDEWNIYRFEAEAGKTIRFAVNSVDNSGSVYLYVRHGAPPTFSEYDAKATDYKQSDPEVRLVDPKAGTYYVGVYCQNDGTGSSDFNLSADHPPLAVREVSPETAGNADTVTLQILGDGFDSQAQVQLSGTGGTTLEGTEDVRDSSTILASFDLAAENAPPGTYDVQVFTADMQSATKPDALTIESGGAAELEANLVVPGVARPGRKVDVRIEFENTGDVDMPSPLFIIESNAEMDWSIPVHRTLTLPPDSVRNASVSVLGLTQSDHPAVIRPGESASIGLRVEMPFNPGDVPFSLYTFGEPGDTGIDESIDWSAMAEELRPDDTPAECWTPFIERLKAQVGDTWGDYLTMLRENAAYLAELDTIIYDSGQLFQFELMQAAAMGTPSMLEMQQDAFCPAPGLPLELVRFYRPGPLQRAKTGPMGYGWSHTYDISLRERSDGSVVVNDAGGVDRAFKPAGDGGYIAPEGDSSRLEAIGGGEFRLTYQNGAEILFRSDGLLNYIEDTNGNRVTAAYDAAGRLIRLTHSNGDRFSFAYNAAGRLASFTDHAGRTITYAYDVENAHLTSVTGTDGNVTGYFYITGEGPLRDHLLKQVSRPGGPDQYFAYDALGRLTQTYVSDEKEKVQYAYGRAGRTFITDAAGNTSTVWMDASGQTARADNPLNNSVDLHYTADGRIAGAVGPNGQDTAFEYDPRGGLTASRNPKGNVTAFGYGGPYHNMAWVSDARGNQTHYDYDDSGNLIRITYVDGTTESWRYDAQGNPLSWTNRRGDVMLYTYNDRGQLIRKEYPDGAVHTYDYDDNGRLVSATDDRGGTTLEYVPDTTWLKKITYPTGRWLAYEYDDAGRRTKLTTHDGFVTHYHYDDAGRLSQLTDKDGNNVVTYTYDSAGRLIREDKGNGTYTTYDYDKAGQVVDLTNHGPDGTPQSYFRYTYDANGLRTAMETHYGTWSYEYDDTGQLIHAILDSTDPDIEDQDLAYEYDAVGNRTWTVINGEVTEYTTNDMNQYIQVGDAEYEYDADGNMVAKIVDGAATTYFYTAANRLFRVTSPEETREYSYGPSGNRISTVSDAGIQKYLVDPTGLGNVMGVYDETDLLDKHYHHGLGLISVMDANEDTNWYSFSAVGNTSELTDSMGILQNQIMYKPFGQNLQKSQSTEEVFRYVGKLGVMYEQAGLRFMRARYYDAKIGRFISEDPLGMTSGEINLNAYAGNSPMVMIDPLGLAYWGFQYNIKIASGGFAIDFKTGDVYPVYSAGPSTPGGTLFFSTSDISPGVYREGGGGYILGISIGHKEPLLNDMKSDSGGYTELLLSTGPCGYYQEVGIGESEFNISKEFYKGQRMWFEYLFRHGLIGSFKQFYGEDLPLFFKGLFSNPFENEKIKLYTSYTPEDKFGPIGYDAPDTDDANKVRYVEAGQTLTYRIEFWNKEEAVVPTQDAIIEDTLEPDVFDHSTLEFTRIGFLQWDRALPGGQVIDTRIDCRPEMNIAVEVTGDFDPDTGTIRWWFHCIDPDTGAYPEDPMAGFLPPFNPETGYEIGWVEFAVQAKDDLPSGTEVENQAFVEFDFAGDLYDHPAPKEGPWLNTLDQSPPTSAIEVLASETGDAVFQVCWGGSDDDDGSGLAHYTVYVSDNVGPKKVWLENTTKTCAMFVGEHGHTYEFFCRATDNTGQTESAKTEAEATTQINDTTGPTIASTNPAADPVPVATRSEITVTFHEPVDEAEAADPAHYTLIASGNTGLFEDGDDTAVVIDSIAYDDATFTATLTVNSDTVLPIDTYWLTLSDGITDLAGNALDGDADGTPGGNFELEFAFTDPASAAYIYMTAAMDEYNDAFDVYTDADAGGNHFYPSGFYNGAATLTVDTRHPDNPHAGTSCIRVDWTGEHGNDGQPWNGVMFETPEGYLGSLAGSGYDITGASKLTFWARTDDSGLEVEFGFGHIDDSSGEHKAWYSLTENWQQFEIDLSGMDLSDVHGGFLFAVNDLHDPAPTGTRFYIDDIKYDLARPDALRLIPSFTPATDTETFDIRNKNLATVYDNALAVLAFLDRGGADDIRRAKILADTLVFVHNNDTNLVPADWEYEAPPFSGHRLRDAYSAGDITDSQGAFRYPGWWEESAGMWYMHESALSFRTGDLAWAMLALTNMYRATGDASYLNAAKEMGEWIAANCERTGSGSNAGYSGGWVWNWDTESWQEIGTATEHNIDLVAVFDMLHAVTGKEKWQTRSDHAKDFVVAMWDGDTARFHTGLNPDGGISDVEVLDIQSWGAMLFATDPYWSALDWAAGHLAYPTSPENPAHWQQFDFNDDLDGVWYEGTAQMAAAYIQAGQTSHYQNSLAPIRAAQYRAVHADGRGIPAAGIPGLTTGFDWQYSNRLALGPTAWCILAENGTSPFTFISIAGPGDIDNSGTVNLVDAVLAMQVTAGIAPPGSPTIHITADCNRDGVIGLTEGVFIMQAISGIR